MYLILFCEIKYINIFGLLENPLTLYNIFGFLDNPIILAFKSFFQKTHYVLGGYFEIPQRKIFSVSTKGLGQDLPLVNSYKTQKRGRDNHLLAQIAHM